MNEKAQRLEELHCLRHWITRVPGNCDRKIPAALARGSLVSAEPHITSAAPRKMDSPRQTVPNRGKISVGRSRTSGEGLSSSDTVPSSIVEKIVELEQEVEKLVIKYIDIEVEKPITVNKQ
eukprot:2963945-Rhodomonas_salina.2